MSRGAGGDDIIFYVVFMSSRRAPTRAKLSRAAGAIPHNSSQSWFCAEPLTRLTTLSSARGEGGL